MTQQCCYDSRGLLLADPMEGRLSIGTPLYQDVSTMVTYYRDTVLPFVHCCKEGIPTGQSLSECSDFQSLLPTNNGEGDVQSALQTKNGNGEVEKQRSRRFIFISIGKYYHYNYMRMVSMFWHHYLTCCSIHNYNCVVHYIMSCVHSEDDVHYKKNLNYYVCQIILFANHILQLY